MEALDNASLMDDLDFLEELEKLEAPRLKPRKTTITADALHAFESERDTRPVSSATAPRFMMPVAKGEATIQAAPSAPPALTRPTLAVAGFMLLMSVGAGAAALVFHDRVEQIVVQWQSASR
jgi:hypothetical protein